MHADAAVFDPEMQLAALRQGVTTLLLGQDGLSFAPASPATIDYVTRYFAPVNGPHPALGGQPVSVADLLAGYDRRVPLNTGYLIPHGTIRYEVMGAARRAPSDDELARMRAMVERGLGEGAAGLSTGLEYAPGGYATVAELAALCAPVAAAGLPYVTHMRGYEASAGRGMAEVAEIARRSGAAAHVSHYHGPAGQLTALLDDARRGGADITFDSYPYVRGCTTLAMVTLPGWLPAADFDATLDALADAGTARRLDDEWSAAARRPVAAHHAVPRARRRPALGRGQSTRRGGPASRPRPGRVLPGAPGGHGLEAGCVFGHPAAPGAAGAAHPEAAAERSMRALLRHPAQMAGSDGIYRGGHPHPRGWGAFARLLGRHVRELGDWTWEQAAAHMAGHPARRFRLADRGLIRRGQAADIVVLDPATVADKATYASPREPGLGVEHVFVNGVRVLSGGALTAAARGAPPAGCCGPANCRTVRPCRAIHPKVQASAGPVRAATPGLLCGRFACLAPRADACAASPGRHWRGRFAG